MVRVLWEDTDTSKHRLGQGGHVDVWCTDTAPGGQYYRDHLAVLDSQLMTTDGNDDDSDDDDEDSSQGVTDGADGEGTCSIRRPLGTCIRDVHRFYN